MKIDENSLRVKEDIGMIDVRRPVAFGSDPMVTMVGLDQLNALLPLHGVSWYNTISYTRMGRPWSNVCHHITSPTDSEWPYTGFLPSMRYRVEVDDVQPTDYKLTTSASYPVALFPRETTPVETGPSIQDIETRKYAGALAVQNGLQPTSMNVPLAIVELKDTGRTIGTVTELIRMILWFYKYCGKPAFRRHPLLLVGITLVEVARLYLEDRYGSGATIRDAKRFIAQMQPERVKVLIKPIPYTRGQKIRAQVNIPLSRYFVAPGVRTYVDRKIMYGANEWSDHEHLTDPTAAQWPSAPQYAGTEVKGVMYATVDGKPRHDNDIFDIVKWAGGFWSSAYELAPFSFVLDWAIDLSTYLSNLEKQLIVAHRGIPLVEGVWSSIATDRCVYAPVPVMNRVVRVAAWEPHNGHLVVDSTVTRGFTSYRKTSSNLVYHRERYGSVLPELPSWNARVTPYRLAAAAALLVSILPTMKIVRKLVYSR